MEAACDATSGAMAAMIGGDEAAVRALADATDVDVANINSPGQIVISGERAKVEVAVAQAKEHGIRRATLLNVAGAYHSRLMESAYRQVGEALLDAELQTPAFPVISNVTGQQVASAGEIRETLQDQVTATVRWTDCMERMLEMGCDLFLELGPGGVLAGLLQRTRKGADVISVCDVASLQAAVARLQVEMCRRRLKRPSVPCAGDYFCYKRVPEMYLPILNARSRVMMFAPHPDDESLAAGVFLQRAVAAGAAVRVIYGTDGEKNCWPQRLLERRARLCEADRRRWGQRRQAEALAALSVLQIRRTRRSFSRCRIKESRISCSTAAKPSASLADLILAWGPTHLLLPSASDTHPDHSGLAVLLRIALENFFHAVTGLSGSIISSTASANLSLMRSRTLADNHASRKRKEEPSLGTAPRLRFSRRRFLAYAQRPERFVVMAEWEP